MLGKQLEWFLATDRGVLWDCDGVIADTEPIHFELFQRILKEEGIVISETDYYYGNGTREGLIVYGDEDAYREAFRRSGKKLSKSKLENLIVKKVAYYSKKVSGVELFPGVAETMRCLNEKHHVRQIVVSGSFFNEVAAILVSNSVHHFIDYIVSAEATELHKPNPDPYLAGIKYLEGCGIRASHCFAVEDTGGGVRSAKSAGLYTVGVTNSATEQALLDAGADVVVRSIQELTCMALGNN